MGYREVTYYQATCDFPDCDSVADEGEYSAMGDPGSAHEQAVSDGWYQESASDYRIFCGTHTPAEEGEYEGTIVLPDGARVTVDL